MSNWRSTIEKHGAPSLALSYVSGEESGTRVPLNPGVKYVLGRGDDADVIIPDRKASRKHAEIYETNGEFFLKDLGSVNGISLNGEKVKLKPLHAGDLVQIGGTSLKVVITAPTSDSAWKWWRGNRHKILPRQRTHGEDSTMAEIMSGSLDTIKPLELLQLFFASNKSGVLMLIGEDQQGEIHLNAGEIYDASIQGKTSLKPEDAVHKLLQCDSGNFEFNTEDVYTPEAGVSVPTQDLLLEAAKRATESN